MTKPVKLLVKVVMQENTKMKLEKRHARIVQQVLMPMVRRPFVMHVLLVNTTTKPVKRLNLLLVKVVLQGNTKMKLEKHRATTIVLVPCLLPWMPDALTILCTGNERVAFVATVVARVTLPRTPRVERGRRR